MFNFVYTTLYHNVVLFDYSNKMSRFMPILGFVQKYSGRHVVNIDLLGGKISARGGGAF